MTKSDDYAVFMKFLMRLLTVLLNYTEVLTRRITWITNKPKWFFLLKHTKIWST